MCDRVVCSTGALSGPLSSMPQRFHQSSDPSFIVWIKARCYVSSVLHNPTIFSEFMVQPLKCHWTQHSQYSSYNPMLRTRLLFILEHWFEELPHSVLHQILLERVVNGWVLSSGKNLSVRLTVSARVAPRTSWALCQIRIHFAQRSMPNDGSPIHYNLRYYIRI